MPVAVDYIGKPADEIRRLVKKFDRHPWDINCGLCEDFAEELVEALGDGAEVVWIADVDEDSKHWSEEIAHAVVAFQGRFYDSEEPFGVEDWKHLPLCARALRERTQERIQYPFPE